MSHLLKRTKKSCLKIFRKISSSKQLFAKKADDDIADDTINNNNNSKNIAHILNNSNSSLQNNNSNGRKTTTAHAVNRNYAIEIETSPMPREKVNHSFRRSTESLPSTTYHRHENENENEKHTTSPKNIHYNNNNNNNNTIINNSNRNSRRPVTMKENMDFLVDEESPNNTILHKLTTRLFLTADGYDFQRLQQLRSDTGSEVVQFDTDTQQDNIVFEKVNYKDDVRYFRHTPSNSSLDNFHPGSVASTPDYDDADFDLDNDWQVNEHCNHRPWNLDPLTNQFTNFGFHATTTATQRDTYRPTINMTLGSKLNGNLQNVIISQERDNRNKLTPVIKWDINGNSLDDDDDLLPHEYLEDFDKRLSKRIAAVQQLQQRELENDNESEDSSLRSSSTTLETWVDEDLLVENSMDVNLRENRCLIKT